MIQYTAARRCPTPCLMLDRDGVLVQEVHHLRRRNDVHIARGATDLIRQARADDWLVCVVTNQSGIARGLLSWDSYEEVEDQIRLLLQAEGLGVDMVLACPFHPDYTPDYNCVHAYWRKPGCGMIDLARQRLNVWLTRSWIIGDRASDLEAGRRAGLAGGVLIQTGYGKEHLSQALAQRNEHFEVCIAADMVEAAKYVRDGFAGGAT